MARSRNGVILLQSGSTVLESVRAEDLFSRFTFYFHRPWRGEEEAKAKEWQILQDISWEAQMLGAEVSEKLEKKVTHVILYGEDGDLHGYGWNDFLESLPDDASGELIPEEDDNTSWIPILYQNRIQSSMSMNKVQPSRPSELPRNGSENLM